MDENGENSKKKLILLSKILIKISLEIYRNLQNSVFSENITKDDIKLLRKNILEFISRKNIPRYLTKEELDDIVSVIPLPTACIRRIREENHKQIITGVKKQLSSHTFSVEKDTIKEIKTILRKLYFKSLGEAGDSVGIMGAMAYSQPLTQGQLNKFHGAGSKDASSEGMNNIEELFNLSSDRELNETVTHFRNKNLTKEEIKFIGKMLKGINIQTLIQKTEILEEIPPEDVYWYKNQELLSGNSLPSSIKYLLSRSLNQNKNEKNRRREIFTSLF